MDKGRLMVLRPDLSNREMGLNGSVTYAVKSYVFSHKTLLLM